MDDYVSLWSRLLNRAPSLGPVLAQQLINDSWAEMQSRREWSFRRRSGVFAPPSMYNTGQVSTNVSNGAPALISGVGTVWTSDFIGRQIRIGGLLFPIYTIVGWLSPTALLIDVPWVGPDAVSQSYFITQSLYPVPSDFGYLYVATSIKDNYRLWTTLTQADLALLDPQRAIFGQTYSVVFKDYTPQYGGVIGPVISVTNPLDPAPISTTSLGYSYVADATFVIQVIAGGISGTATYQWLRTPQTVFQPVTVTSDQPFDLSDGVQVYWPDGVSYNPGDIFIINCRSQISAGTPRMELWPAPSQAGYLYPYIYIAKESALTVQSPSLPPFMANRGECLLEMALEKSCMFAGSDDEHLNLGYSLKDAMYHGSRWKEMMVDLERNDEELTAEAVTYQNMPMAPASWLDGAYRQHHAWGPV